MSALLISTLVKKMNLKNDAALGHVLDIQAPTISKIRSGYLYPGSSILVTMHEESGLSIRELKELRGVDPKNPKAKMWLEKL
jgi:hypothetical protein